MSSAPYSASIIALLPILAEPVLEAKKLTVHSAIASADDSTTPIVMTYWPGSEPRAAGVDDVAFVSGSVRFTSANGKLTAFSDGSFVNVIVPGEDAGAVNPASNITAVFFLTGMVTVISPGEREFELETGSWVTEASSIVRWTAICRIPSNKRWENTVPPTLGSPASVRARYDGHLGGKPIFVIEDLTYLPKLLRAGASPRKGNNSSGPSTPSTPTRLFGGKKRPSSAADAEGEGPSTPSPKRIRTREPVVEAPDLSLQAGTSDQASATTATPPSPVPKKREASKRRST